MHPTAEVSALVFSQRSFLSRIGMRRLLSGNPCTQKRLGDTTSSLCAYQTEVHLRCVCPSYGLLKAELLARGLFEETPRAGSVDGSDPCHKDDYVVPSAFGSAWLVLPWNNGQILGENLSARICCTAPQCHKTSTMSNCRFT